MASEAIMAGYMERKTGENSWDRYWHVLRDGCLYCYLREGEEANVCVTELGGYCLYCRLDQIPGKRFVLHLHNADYIPVYLSVDSRDELEAWTTSFQKALADASAQWSDGTPSSGNGQGRELSAAERQQLVKQKLLAEVLRQKQELERQQAARRKKARAEDAEERETTEEEEEPEEPESPVLQDYSYLTRLKQRRMSTQIKMDALQRQLQPSAHQKRSLFNFGKRKSEEEEARNPYIVQQLQELSERMEQIDSHLEQTQTSPRYPGLPDRGEPRLAKQSSDNRLAPAASSGEAKKFLKNRAGSREDLMSGSSGPRRSQDSRVSEEAGVDARPGGHGKKNVRSSTDLQNGGLDARSLRASGDFVDGAQSGSKFSSNPVTFTLGPRTEQVNGDWSGSRSLTRSGAVTGSGSGSGHHHTFRTVQHVSADSDDRQYSDSASAELSSPGSIPGSPSSSRIGGLKSSLGRLAHRTFGRAGWSLGNKKTQSKGSSSYVASSAAIESDPDSDVFVYDPPPDFIDLTRASRPAGSRVRDTSSSSDDADVTAPISATRAAPVQAGRGFKVSDTSTDPSPPSSSRSSGSCQSPGGPAHSRNAGTMGGGAGMVNGHAHPVLDSPRREISASALAEIEAFERMTQEALAKIPRSKAKS